MRHALLVLAILALGFGFSPAWAADAPAPAAPATPAPAAKSFSDAERAGIEAIIKDYLTKEHPEVIMEAAGEAQRRESVNAEARTQEAVAKSKDKIFNDPNSPFAGDPKGDVTIVEFYDYNCGYCKMSEPALEKLLKEDKKLKVVYKDFPILGQASLDATKASLASVKQGKFQKFHDSLMSNKDHVSEATIAAAAKDAGIDTAQMKKDAGDASVQKIVDENLKLGSDVGVRGTPMFIINDKVYPGALQYESLKKAIDDARAGAKKS